MGGLFWILMWGYSHGKRPRYEKIWPIHFLDSSDQLLKILNMFVKKVHNFLFIDQ